MEVKEPRAMEEEEGGWDESVVEAVSSELGFGLHAKWIFKCHFL